MEGLRESNAIRFEELRETNAELSSVQAASYLTRKDLDQARKDMTAMNVQLLPRRKRSHPAVLDAVLFFRHFWGSLVCFPRTRGPLLVP